MSQNHYVVLINSKSVKPHLAQYNSNIFPKPIVIYLFNYLQSYPSCFPESKNGLEDRMDGMFSFYSFIEKNMCVILW